MKALGIDNTPQLTRKITVIDTCYTIWIIILAQRNRSFSPEEVYKPPVHTSSDKIHT